MQGHGKRESGSVGGVFEITPAKANEWLQSNVRNRPLNQANFARLVGAIRRGEWKLNYETIKFSKSGRLLDGQHRLRAVVETGITIPSLVVFDVDDDAFDTIDIGRKRLAGDVLAIMGEKHYSTLAGGIRLCVQIMQRPVRIGFHVSNVEVERFLEQNPDIRFWADFATQGHCRKIMDPSVMCGLGYVFSLKDQDAALEFFDRVADGVGLLPKSPMLTLREHLMMNKASLRRATKTMILAFIIKAWNCYRHGRPMSLCRFDPEREQFPFIQ